MQVRMGPDLSYVMFSVHHVALHARHVMVYIHHMGVVPTT
jgi:hypothetical protein